MDNNCIFFLNLVMSLSIQGLGKFPAKYWPPSFLEAPRSNREKQVGVRTDGIFSPPLLHSWLFSSAPNNRKTVEWPFQCKR